MTQYELIRRWRKEAYAAKKEADSYLNPDKLYAKALKIKIKERFRIYTECADELEGLTY